MVPLNLVLRLFSALLHLSVSTDVTESVHASLSRAVMLGNISSSYCFSALINVSVMD